MLLYPVLADIEDVKYELLELDDQFKFNGKLPNKIKLLLIANPNAPTSLFYLMI